MRIRIIEASNRRELKQFVRFPMNLYRDCPYFVPPLLQDELDSFDKTKNPALETAMVRPFLAIKDNQVVGRIAGILSHAANAKSGKNDLRFGWFDTVENYGVAKALFDRVTSWGLELGMDTLSGPQGFSSFDRTGMLIDGFDQMPTFAVSYNFPYYNDLMARCGFEKREDFVEYRANAPVDGVLPARLLALVDKLKQRGRFRLLELSSRKELVALAPKIFDLMEEAYGHLPDAVPLSVRQREYYTKKFLGYLNPALVRAAVDRNDELAGFIVGVPSLSDALRKARGRLFPLGIFHLLRAMRQTKTLDMCLAAVGKRYQGMGVDLLMTADLLNEVMRRGFSCAESNPEWENNSRIQALWKPYNPVLHKRRRVYEKRITLSYRQAKPVLLAGAACAKLSA